MTFRECQLGHLNLHTENEKIWEGKVLMSFSGTTNMQQMHRIDPTVKEEYEGWLFFFPNSNKITNTWCAKVLNNHFIIVV